ncbi:acyl-CoA dehydrogenase family protein [Cupriavidus basilensis]
MEKTIELTAEYLKTRQQFGVPIGSFQALQHRIADMAAEMEVARSMLHAALASLTNDDAATQQQVLSAAKMLIGRAAKFVCGQGIQLHGGIGMTEEYTVGHYYKRAVVADLLLGSSDSHEARLRGGAASGAACPSGLRRAQIVGTRPFIHSLRARQHEDLRNRGPTPIPGGRGCRYQRLDPHRPAAHQHLR